MPKGNEIAQLVKASPNFGFLGTENPKMLRAIVKGERYVFSDPVSALIRIRQFAELLSIEVAAINGIYINKDNGDNFYSVCRELYNRRYLTREIYNIFTNIRKQGNHAVHEAEGTAREALHQLKMAHRLAAWFHKTFMAYSKTRVSSFIIPPNPKERSQKFVEELKRLRLEVAEKEVKMAQLDEKVQSVEQLRQVAEKKAEKAYRELEEALELAEETEEQRQKEFQRYQKENEEWQAHLDTMRTQSQKRTVQQTEEVIARSQQAGSFDAMDFSEAETRKIIDQQLREAGWEVDTENLTYKKGVRPTKNKNLAISEYPTASGPADYVLFVGLTPVGVIEAKRKAVDVRGALVQSERYSKNYVVKSDEVLLKGDWGEYKIPLLFAANGRPYHRQFLEKSGIWFQDVRRSINLPKALEGWYTPQGIMDLLKQDHDKAEKFLEQETMDYLGLRYYQQEAIRAVENGISNGKTELLLAMATGTGKTRTALGLIYRLIKAKRFRRILFLVDRTSLGEQAEGVFHDVKLESLQAFSQIYDVKGLNDIEIEADTRLHVATVQGMVRRLLYATEDSKPLPVDQYDCIIVDESHRGYNLDKEMSDSEVEFRSAVDYISKYRRVLDHFDAVQIGLTATPALHTKEIFGIPVYEYSYRKAVIDGYLIDHEPPILIHTELNQKGIQFLAGEKVEEYQARTGEIISYEMPDDVDIEVDGFNTKVRTESFNRTVCQFLAKEIDPDLPGKTLIFCANDSHADMVERLLQEEYQAFYENQKLPKKMFQKLTGKTDRHNNAIRVFKNEKLPKFVTTVDLLTTGIDVPEITNLVFLRRVRSRILYEQMLGRATRRCDEIDKEVFYIYDAVGLYEALKDYSTMKPVVQKVRFNFSQLSKELHKLQNATFAQEVVDEFLAKFHRIKGRLTSEALEGFQILTKSSPEEFISTLQSQDLEQIKTVLNDTHQVAEFLDNLKPKNKRGQLISNEEDSFMGTSRGYGKGQKPDDYLEGFKDFIQNSGNQIPALMVVTQRPRELTRQQLKELELILANNGYSEKELRAAWQDKTNQDIAASIIGFIRQQALGIELLPYEERVQKALKKIMFSHNWTRSQKGWLQKIGQQLLKEIVVDKDSFNKGRFKAKGGFKQFNKIFEGKLETLLLELQAAVWMDAG